MIRKHFIRSRLVLPLLGLTALLTGPPARGQSCTPLLDNVSTQEISSVTLDVQGADTAESTAVDDGAGQWNDECGSILPSFTRTSGGELTITMEFRDQQSPSDPSADGYCSGRCGCFDLVSTVYVYDSDENGTDCSQYNEAIVAHELGHVLGLDDVESGCTGSLMGDTLLTTLQVTADECSAVDDLWSTEIERTQDPDPDHPCQNPPK